MRARTLLIALVALALVAGGFAGRGLVNDHASAKGPWTVAYVTADCKDAPACAGQQLQGDVAGDQSKLSNLIARASKDDCDIQSVTPYGSAWFVVVYRC